MRAARANPRRTMASHPLTAHPRITVAVLLSVLLPALAAGAPTGAGGAVTVASEPGYAVTSTVDWSSATILVEITHALDPSIPSLVRAKGDAETDVEGRLPDFLPRAAGPVVVDSSHTYDDVLGADAGLHARVSALTLRARRTDVFLSPDFSTLVERYAVALFGGQGIALPLLPSRATPIRTLLGDITTRRYTGLLIDARGFLPEAGTARTAALQPALFPRIWDEQMNLVLDKGSCDPESLARWGVAGYARTLDDDVAVVRAGVLPLRLAARGVFGEKATDVVISTEGARQLLALPENIALLREGRVVIVYGPQE